MYDDDPKKAIDTMTSALVGLVGVEMDSRVHHLRTGRRGAGLRDAVAIDVHDAAELLETGLATLSRCPQDSG